MPIQEKVSAEDEVVFLDNLLSGLDAREPRVDRVTRRVRSPTKARRASCIERPSSSKENDGDLAMLLDGAETWDWADMEADFMTPKKSHGKAKVRVHHLCSSVIPCQRNTAVSSEAKTVSRQGLTPSSEGLFA